MAITKAGFSRDQALGTAPVIHDHASEAELRELELRIEARRAQFQTRIEQKLADVPIGLVKRFTGIMIAQGAVIVALIRLLSWRAQPPAVLTQR